MAALVGGVARRPHRTLRRKQQGFIGIGIRTAMGGGGGGGPTLNPGGGWSFFAPLQTSLMPSIAQGSYTPTYSRASIATVRDFENRVITVLSGEARFEGARRVRNIINFSQAIDSWTQALGTTTSANSVTAPDGSQTADRVTFPAAVDGERVETSSAEAAVNGRTYRYSVWLKGSGTVNINVGTSSGVGGESELTITLSSEWVRYTTALTASSPTGNPRVMVIRRSGNTAAQVDVWGAQVEDVTGQSNQNPAEYVSTNALAAPYHGANVDGVKYFDTENGNTVSSNIVTERAGRPLEGFRWAGFTGGTGQFISTPDSTPLSITGDIDIIVDVRPDDWTPSGFQPFVSKIISGGGNGGYLFGVQPSGQLELWITDSIAATSTVATGLTDRTRKWLRVTRQRSNGEVRFYTSDDYDPITATGTWTALGNSVIASAGASLIDNSQALEIGRNQLNVAQVLSGRVYYAEVRSTIGGAAVSRFDPKEWTSGATWVSSTGETWTINGNAKIIVPRVDAGGVCGYRPEGARTNLILHASDASQAAWVKTDTTPSSDGVTASPDGLLTNVTLLTEGVAGTATLVQTVTATADAVYSVSRRFKRGNHDFVRFVVVNGANQFGKYINLATGALGTTIVGGTGALTSSDIEHLGDGWYEVRLVGTVGSAATAISVLSASALADNNATRVNNGTRHEWGGQFENNGTAVTSFIPTTTGAVARSGDALTYAGAGNVAAASGTLLVEVARDTRLAAGECNPVWIDTTGPQLFLDLSNDLYLKNRADNRQIQLTADFTPVAVHKVALTWAVGVGYSGVIDGGTVQTDTQTATPTVTQIVVSPTSAPWIGTIRNLGIKTRAESSAWIDAITA